MKAHLLLSLVALNSLVACRTPVNKDAASEAKVATSSEFRYDTIVADVVDKDNRPVEGVPVQFRSLHWQYQIARLPNDIPILIPIFDPKWVAKQDHMSIVGYTNAQGHMESGPFSVRSSGVLPGTGPAEFVLSITGWIPAYCDGRGDLLLDSNIGKLETLDAKPADRANRDVACQLDIEAKTDNNNMLYLKCRSDRSAEEIAAGLANARKNCLP